MRSDLGLSDKEPNKAGDPKVTELSEKIDKAIEKLQDTVEGQLKALNRKDGPAAVFDKVSALDRLSLPAQELAKTIRRAHLTRTHYDALQKGPLGSVLRELREAGLLVPLRGKEEGKKTPVYYFPPGQANTLRSALLLMPSAPSSVKALVKSELEKVGYGPDRFSPPPES
ncbi:MAG TPA: hypothetical protein VFT65_00655 [Candidatus Angelobacter sp.]|nr:hypothetical protein [Candidatus Angelobacter sp.]